MLILTHFKNESIWFLKPCWFKLILTFPDVTAYILVKEEKNCEPLNSTISWENVKKQKIGQNKIGSTWLENLPRNRQALLGIPNTFNY